MRHRGFSRKDRRGQKEQEQDIIQETKYAADEKENGLIDKKERQRAAEKSIKLW